MWSWIPAGLFSEAGASATGSFMGGWSLPDISASPAYEPLAMLATGVVLITAASLWRRKFAEKPGRLHDDLIDKTGPVRKTQG
ncbi:MAG: hypothetical protein PHG91_03515 [Syntrophales bacterium]|nr:hypothetical protein [Syntrophales bacterium]MDD5232444.1 hypothetical protein [Syntrophales bacterium]MDD5533142.1 hypothetical protein [Syntrophales bacterium]HPL62327.1 hypothetical protein [Syntrophales bacterium]